MTVLRLGGKTRIKILFLCDSLGPNWFLDKAKDTGGFLNFGIQLHELVQRLLVSVPTANYIPFPRQPEKNSSYFFKWFITTMVSQSNHLDISVKWCKIISTY